MVRRKAVLERYAALRCLWHGVVGRSKRLIGSRPVPSVARRPVRACVCRDAGPSAGVRVVHGVLGGPVRRCGRHVRLGERA
eukprot:193368-Prymnesium_polylepis.1